MKAADQKTLIVYVKLQFLPPVIIKFTFEETHFLGNFDQNGEERMFIKSI